MLPSLRRSWMLCCLAGVGLSLASLLLAVVVGSVALSPAQLWGVLTGNGDVLAAALLDLRLERAVTAWLTGAALALAGLLMQVLLRNALADPYVLGLSGGAATGALLAMLLGAAMWLTQLAALAGAALATVLVALLARQALWQAQTLEQASSRLLLSGVILAAGWGALVTLLLALAPDGQLRSMVFWLMGDLGSGERAPWVAPVLLLCMLLLLRQGRALNVLALGAEAAANLGLAVAPLRRRLLLLASVLAALAVSTAGSIGFVGLIVPHACRLALGQDHRLLLPASVLAGGGFLVLADVLARTLLAPQQLPVGVITALIGVPLFLGMLLHERR